MNRTNSSNPTNSHPRENPASITNMSNPEDGGGQKVPKDGSKDEALPIKISTNAPSVATAT